MDTNEASQLKISERFKSTHVCSKNIKTYRNDNHQIQDGMTSIAGGREGRGPGGGYR